MIHACLLGNLEKLLQSGISQDSLDVCALSLACTSDSALTLLALLFQVIDMPLLFETHAQRFMSAIVVVYCDPKDQLQRLKVRNKLTEEEASSRIASQMPIKDKVSRATHVIDNSGSPEQTVQQVWFAR
jgi:dephospho-CoA kinase